MLPQSCIGFSLTLVAPTTPNVASTVPAVRGSGLAAATSATPFYFFNVPGAAVGLSMAAA